MAQENDVTIDAEAPAVTAPDLSRKQRKPRAKKASAEDSAGSVWVDSRKRGRKAKSDKETENAKRPSLRRGRQARQSTSPEPDPEIAEMMDLLQLEQENQKLRKLLAEKLRSENADLRKRLNLD